MKQAAALLAAVVGQDLDEGEDGVFRIARRVAKDRIISTVDPDARHGHKTSARGFDGYKGHVAVDPDSELITATTVTAGNVGDGQAVDALLADELANAEVPSTEDAPPGGSERSPATPAEPLSVYGDSAYGAGSVLDTLEQADAEIMCKVQAPNAPGGRFAKDAFGIDLTAGTVTCPAGQTAPLQAGQGRAHRPLRPSVPGMPARRAVHHLAQRALDPRRRLRATASRALARGRPTRRGRPTTPPPAPRSNARSAHLMRRRHGGRRARVRGHTKVDADFSLLAAAVNLARLATLGVTHHTGGWAVSTA